MNLLALLTDRSVITPAQAAAFEQEARTTGKTLEEVVEKNGINSSALLAAKGEYYQIPTRSIGAPVPFEILRYIPEESAAHYRFVPLAVADGVLEVGIVDPDNIEARDALNFISSKVGLPYKVYLINERDFAGVIENYRGLSGEVGKALTELATEVEPERTKEVSVGSADEEITEDTGSGAITEDAPVTKIVATIIRYATEGGASDIHIEPLPTETRVRFRVDGELTTSLKLPAKVHNAVAARIKVLCNMRLDEKRKPQDGRFSARVDGRKVDFRVSTFPTYHGEKVEMRILGLEVDSKTWTLESLGMSEHDLALVREAVKKPYGLILISGPTGSGKSTSLYAMLNEVDREKHNVLSLEDPVEYTIPGVSQSQVRPEIGYTFATGLRTTLRQDPDIIMVGEIRDKETAQLAVQAALTGHLVLSTIHTNNSVGIVPRLIDMGVDPYLIPPTLILGIAQRLVRTLCPGSGKQVPIEGSLKAILDKEFEDLPKEYKNRIPKTGHVYRLNPSPECPNGTRGRTRGRTAVFEVMEMNTELERIVLANKPAEDIYAVARKNGMLTMREDAIIKSMQGTVPFEEVNTLGNVFDLESEAMPAIPEEPEAPIEEPEAKPAK
jgi:type IV pilus assembly protein PilB